MSRFSRCLEAGLQHPLAVGCFVWFCGVAVVGSFLRPADRLVPAVGVGLKPTGDDVMRR